MQGDRDARAPGLRPALATVAAVVSIAATVAAVLLHRHVVGVEDVARFWIGDVIVATAYPVVGAIIVRRQPGNVAGWILVSSTLIGLFALGGQVYVLDQLVPDVDVPLAELGGWVHAWAWAPHLLLPSLLPLSFPDGRLPSPRWRWLPRVVLCGAALAILARALSPSVLDASYVLRNPWAPLPEAVGEPLTMVGVAVAFGIGVPGALAGLIVRIRRTRGAERAQAMWLLAGAVLVGGSLAAQSVTPEGLDDLVWSIGLAGAIVTILISVVRYRLFDIELVVNRTLVGLTLAGLVVAAYVATVWAVGWLELPEHVAIGAIGLAALLAASARQSVSRVVDRLLYGPAHDPYGVLVRVGGRLDQAGAPREALASLVDELRDALRLPYAAVLGHGDPISSGRPVDRVETVPVAVQGRVIGELVVGVRPGPVEMGPGERTVLTDVARRAGAVLQAALLVDELQASRERIVAAREEERRRLRHDLHDGVGPRLAAMALQLDALGSRLEAAPELRDRVDRLRSAMRDTVGEVRRVVDDLRPPALDEIGLVAAIREHVAGLDAVVDVDVHAPPALPPLGAAVEVAIYRIVTEAVTNAVRHAAAARLDVRIDVDGSAVTIEVADDGCGIAGPLAPGLGIASMTERSVELGGSLEVLAPPTGGTTVRARVPLHRHEEVATP